MYIALFSFCGSLFSESAALSSVSPGYPAILQKGPLPDAWIPELVTPLCSYSVGTLLAHLGWPGIYNNAAWSH